MATIIANERDGKIVSFKFKICLGRDENKKQIFRCLTWYPNKKMTKNQMRKEASIAASLWEKEQREHFSFDGGRPMKSRNITELTFSAFANEVWMPLAVNDGAHRNTTIEMYNFILTTINSVLGNTPLQEITSIQITEYLQWLRKDYRTPLGKAVSDSTVKHHYDILRIMFAYAEKHDYVQHNPIKKVDAPKVQRKKVDALSIEEASTFFKAIEHCDLPFRCMLMIMITSGLRRGECLGLQWQDIDFHTSTLSVQRSVTYTRSTGIEISLPKTANSIREIPIMESVLSLLSELRQMRKAQFHNTALSKAFLFCRTDDPFTPRDPTCITRATKRFFRKVGLPDMSPHDLRHSCASLLLASGANIKSVQDILGHADARTTLNYYAKSDMRQARSATTKYAEAFGL